jgi:hypothetical protein
VFLDLEVAGVPVVYTGVTSVIIRAEAKSCFYKIDDSPDFQVNQIAHEVYFHLPICGGRGMCR